MGSDNFEPPFNIWALQAINCPLGQISSAGTKWDSQATYGHTDPPDYMRPTTEYLLVYTLEGEADYRDETGIMTLLRKGALVWTAPGVNQSYGPCPGSRWSELFIWFNGPVFDAWQQNGFPGEKSRILHLEPVEYWVKRFSEVLKEPEVSNLETSILRICQLQSILAEALEIQNKVDRNIEDKIWLEKACRKLREGSISSPPLSEIAKSMAMSYTLFRKRFLHLYGKSPGQYRTAEIMHRASQDLIISSDSIAQIAERYGFHDQFHFSKRFKQITGMTPTEFRKRI